MPIKHKNFDLGQEVDDDLFDDYILPKDYLPKRLASLSNDVEMITKGEREKTTEENITFTENKKISETFLGRVEETTASCNESDKAQSIPAETLLQSTSSELNSTENSTESTKVHSESANQLICNRGGQFKCRPRHYFKNKVQDLVRKTFSNFFFEKN